MYHSYCYFMNLGFVYVTSKLCTDPNPLVEWNTIVLSNFHFCFGRNHRIFHFQDMILGSRKIHKLHSLNVYKGRWISITKDWSDDHKDIEVLKLIPYFSWLERGQIRIFNSGNRLYSLQLLIIGNVANICQNVLPYKPIKSYFPFMY